jgi:hypothetical protein
MWSILGEKPWIDVVTRERAALAEADENGARRGAGRCGARRRRRRVNAMYR